MGDDINTAREAILQELKRCWVKDSSSVTVPRDLGRFYHPQTNYFCGDGEMACPICKTGRLQYQRSSHNGHVHAQCSIAGCVSWRE